MIVIMSMSMSMMKQIGVEEWFLTFAQICSTSLDVRRRAFDGWVEVRRTGSEDGILHLYYTSGTGQSITPGQWRQA
jgi:hypothetical protein